MDQKNIEEIFHVWLRHFANLEPIYPIFSTFFRTKKRHSRTTIWLQNPKRKTWNLPISVHEFNDMLYEEFNFMG